MRNILIFFLATAGPSAPWTGMIKFTEEDPTGIKKISCCFVLSFVLVFTVLYCSFSVLKQIFPSLNSLYECLHCPPPPAVGIVPGEPTDVVVTEATKSYVVLAWKPPVQRGHEGVMYYIEKVVIIAFLKRSLPRTLRTWSDDVMMRSCAGVDVSAFQGQTAGRE